MDQERTVLQNFSVIATGPHPPPDLEIIAQPCCTARIRYRSEFNKTKHRRGALQSENNPNYNAPTIRISPAYLDPSQEYYIRVCLVTVPHERNNAHYIHPYELEDIDVQEYNDRHNKVVWYPVVQDDVGGIKSFPSLRIVRIKADQLMTERTLQILDFHGLEADKEVSSPKETNREYQLNRAQLAFTIAQKTTVNGSASWHIYTHTTVYSDELVQLVEKEAEGCASSERPSRPRNITRQVYKYAPRNGYTGGNEEVLIFYDDKLKPEKYGELEVTFESGGPNDQPWSAAVIDLEVRDQMLAFKTPMFPFLITEPTPVNIVVKQRKRSFEPLKYFYVSMPLCQSCQATSIQNQIDQFEPNSNKRPFSLLDVDDDEDDSSSQMASNDQSSFTQEEANREVLMDDE